MVRRRHAGRCIEGDDIETTMVAKRPGAGDASAQCVREEPADVHGLATDRQPNSLVLSFGGKTWGPAVGRVVAHARAGAADQAEESEGEKAMKAASRESVLQELHRLNAELRSDLAEACTTRDVMKVQRDESRKLSDARAAQLAAASREASCLEMRLDAVLWSLVGAQAVVRRQEEELIHLRANVNPQYQAQFKTADDLALAVK